MLRRVAGLGTTRTWRSVEETDGERRGVDGDMY